LLFLVVHSEWQLVLPGIGYGVSHALMFPCVVAAGSSAFPDENRGVGNLLILATFDLGILVGAPLFGATLEAARFVGLPGYAAAFLAVACMLAATGLVYRLTWRRGEEPWEHLPDFHKRASTPQRETQLVVETASGE
jgi:MFS family permease